MTSSSCLAWVSRNGDRALARYPLMIVLYKFSKVEDLLRTSPETRWLRKANASSSTCFRTILAHRGEQHLLFRLLKLNSSLMPPAYAVNRWDEEAAFKMAFLLPCIPLNSCLLTKLQFPSI